MNTDTVVCRLCLKKNHDLKSNDDVYGNKSGDPLEDSLEQLISQYLPIQIIKSEDSDYPYICRCCTSKIKRWHRFCTACIDNDRIYMQRFLEQLTGNGRTFLQEEVMLPKEEMLDTFVEEQTIDLYVKIEPTDGNEKVVGEPSDGIVDDRKCSSPETEIPKQAEPQIENFEAKPEVTEDVKSSPKKCKTPKKKKKRPDDGLNLFLRKPCTRTPKGETPVRHPAEMCPMCGKFVKVLKEHMRVHIDDRRYQCPHCPKTFVARGTFRNHVNIHTRAKLHQCEQCGKEFVHWNSFKAHLVTHTKERKYVCPMCEKSFYQRTSFVRHKREHTQKRTVKCTECDRMFFSNGAMRHHFRMHLSERPYACTICERAFYRNSNLKTHMKIHERKKTELVSLEVTVQDAADSPE